MPVPNLFELCLATLPATSPERWLASWSLAPETALPIAALMLVYALGAARSPERVGGGWRAASFLLGWLALVVALVSPLCRLAATLAWAHMVQHVLLVAVAPPLLLLGAPGATLAAGLPARLRRLRLPAAPGVLTATWPVTLFYGLAIWGWHAPPLYEAALRSEAVHLLMVGSLLGLGLLFWRTSVATPLRDPETHGQALLASFLTAVHTGALGALITFSTTLWWPILGPRAALWGLSPLADQQLAGIIMWAPMSAIYLVAGLGLMGGWLQGLERRAA